MDAFYLCRIMAFFIMIIILVTLVSKENDNPDMVFFFSGLIMVLICTAISLLASAAAMAADSAEMLPVVSMFSAMGKLIEIASLAAFVIFVKRTLFNAGLNVKIWFAMAASVYVISLIICIAYPHTRLDICGLSFMYLIVFAGYELHLENDRLKRELDLSEARTALLMRQISPHFIFNSLQVIIGLCDSEPQKVRPALEHFSEYLRNNLESISKNDLIPFMEELDHTKEYLILEQYGDGKDFSVKYDLKVTDFMIPPLVLQPVVENAIQYGVDTHERGSCVIIETEETPFTVIIRVKDDGTGKTTITNQQKERQSVGLKNVRTRLSALCGGDVKYESGPEGTTVTIIILK